MRKDYADRYQKEEATHWWIKGRRDIVKALVAQEDRDAKVLDIGCSGGLLMKELSDLGFRDVHGVDLSRTGVAMARKRGQRNARVADGTKMPYRPNSFDVLIASDILEHIPDEGRALREWARVLKPGGKAYLFVPAFMSLWSAQDEVNFHQRRYRRKELAEKVRRQGLEVVRSSYWNFLLFFPKTAVAVFVGVTKPKGEQPLFFFGSFINTLLSWLMWVENSLMAIGIDYPVGVSAFVLARKKRP
jgi:SAM-dependent methyltransferase